MDVGFNEYKIQTLKLFPKLKTDSKAGTIVICLQFWALFIALFYITGPITPMFPVIWKRFIFGVFGTFFALLLTWVFLRYEKKSFAEIGLAWQPGTLLNFIKGLLIGAIIFGIILLALLIFTPLRIQPNSSPPALAAIVGYLAFVPLSLMEEIAYRAFPFRKLEGQFGLMITQVIVAVIFALAHVAGGQSVASSFLGPGVYAFVFGLAAVWSGGIAMPFGIHLALNVLQPLTGMRGKSEAVWTLTNQHGVINNNMASPDTVGLAMQVLIFVVSVILTHYYIRHRKRIKI